MRKEQDFLGVVEIPGDALFGIHSSRARDNFPDHTPFPVEWYRAVGLVKQACYLTYRDYAKAVEKKFRGSVNGSGPGLIPEDIVDAMILSASEVAYGKYYENFIVPAISGGAGTSINMNVNEIIVNASLLKAGSRPGNYSLVDPVEHANVFQSTNDVIPTSLKICLMQLLGRLEVLVNDTRASVEKLENAHRHDLRIGYTQMQEAVPTSFGKLFSTYSEALSRDWWRVSKCMERLKLVNLGGSAVGTGIAVPRFFIMEAVGNLQKLTGLNVARSENLPDATSNHDSLVEVHAIIKAHAVNLEKMVSDLRLLASDFGKPFQSLNIPARQTGSSIMPGKVNPVIPEFVISCAHRVYSNDQMITSLSAQGCLELNAYLPAIGLALTDSISLLIACNKTLTANLISGIQVNEMTSLEKVLQSPSITTALVPLLGYHKAAELARLMISKRIDIYDANSEMGLVSREKLETMLKPENLLKMGYTVNDLRPES
jgi:aspartate ammonia-lyase